MSAVGSAPGEDALSAGSAAAAASGRQVLLVGGTSEIGLAIVRALGASTARGADTNAVEGQVTLVGRDGEALQRARDQLAGAFPERSVHLVDRLEARDPRQHGEVLEGAFATMPRVEVAILAVGLLGERDFEDLPAAVDVLDVNLTGAGSLLLHLAKLMRRQGGGEIVVLSSAGAVRARASNAAYGAAKAGLDALALALGDALLADGVRVTVVRPGFVRTRMTAGLKEPPLACTPEAVADATIAGLRRRASVVWVPSSMRWTMLVLRLLPRAVYRRLPL